MKRSAVIFFWIAVNLFQISLMPLGLAAPKKLPPPYNSLVLPEETGAITEYHPGRKPFTVYYIQDAHGNYDAQKNIAEIVKFLVKERGILLVFVEGGVGDVSLSAFHAAPKAKRMETAESFLKEGKISGEEYLSLVSDDPPPLWGIESQVLYDENLAAYERVEPDIRETLEDIEKIRHAIRQLKPKLYPGDYLRFEESLEGMRRAGDNIAVQFDLVRETAKRFGIDLVNYPNAAAFFELRDVESGFDFDRVAHERDELVIRMQAKVPSERIRALMTMEKEGRRDALKQADFYTELLSCAREFAIDVNFASNTRSAIHYMKGQQQIDFMALMAEFERLRDQIAGLWLPQGAARTLYRYDVDIQLLESLARLELVHEQNEVFLRDRDRFRTVKWIPFLTAQAERGGESLFLPDDLKRLDDRMDLFQAFYRSAYMRDQALAENLTRKVREENASEVILIAGGFHKERLVRKLLRNDFCVIVITPRLSGLTSQEHYHELLAKRWAKGEWRIPSESSETRI